MDILKFTVPPEWDGRPLKEFLRLRHGVSGTTLKRAKRLENGITQNGAHIRTVDPVAAGAEIRLIVDPQERTYRPSETEVPVLYEDESLVAFDKPAGLVVHPSKGHPWDTLANVFAARPETAGKTFRPLDRLDRDTTGIVLAAKNAHAAKNTLLTEKLYLGILYGAPAEDRFVFDGPIGREREDSQKRCVRPDGQPARTRCRILEERNGYSAALFSLETGRTHQIRVHAASLGCPLAGDPLYGTPCEEIRRQALHCLEIGFVHPMTGEDLRIRSPLPPDLTAAAAAFGFKDLRALLDGTNMV